MRRAGLVGIAAAISLLLAQSLPVAAAPGGRSQLRRHTPAFVGTTPRLGPANANNNLDVTVWLAPRDAPGMLALATDVADPANPGFAQYLTPAQFDASFAPTRQAYTAVRDYLRGQGLQITATAADRLYIAARGTIGQVESAFGIRMDRYKVGGRVVVANSGNPSLPSSLVGDVAAVGGLDGAAIAHPQLARRGHGGPVGGGGGLPTPAKLCAAIAPNGTTPGYIPCPFDPAGLRTATGLGRRAPDGAGQTIAIVDAYGDPTLGSDLGLFDSTFGVPRTRLEQIGRTTWSANDPNATGWNAETALDVEWAHAMAPSAAIRLYVAPNSSNTLFQQVADIVARGSAHLISLSWDTYEAGTPPALLAALDNIFAAAALEGIGVSVASGDCGDESACVGVPTVDFPASSPFVTATGGLSLLPHSAPLAWGTTVCVQKLAPGQSTTLPGCPQAVFAYGGGGGESALFPAGPWQQTADGRRALPDVSMDADPYTGAWVTVAGGYAAIGGTSLAAPTFTGLMALADQAAGFHHGLAAPWLYRIAEPAGAITDVLPGTTTRLYQGLTSGNTYQIGFGQDQGLTAAPGWDDATGLGLPQGSKLTRVLMQP